VGLELRLTMLSLEVGERLDTSVGELDAGGELLGLFPTEGLPMLSVTVPEAVGLDPPE
jgi:hypothetical protein